MPRTARQSEAAFRARVLGDVRILVSVGHYRNAAQRLGELRLHLEREFEDDAPGEDPIAMAGRRMTHTRLMDALSEVWDAVCERDRLEALVTLERLRRILVLELAGELTRPPTHRALTGLPALE